MRESKREIYSSGGSGVAIAGIVTNLLALFSIIPIALIILDSRSPLAERTRMDIPRLGKARIETNEYRVIGAMLDFQMAEATYQAHVGKGRRFGSMEELLAEHLIRPDAAHKNGYHLKIRLFDVNGNAVSPGSMDAVRFEALGTPDTYGSSGRRSFYTSENDVVRCGDKNGSEATQTDPPMEEYFGDGFYKAWSFQVENLEKNGSYPRRTRN